MLYSSYIFFYYSAGLTTTTKKSTEVTPGVHAHLFHNHMFMRWAKKYNDFSSFVQGLFHIYVSTWSSLVILRWKFENMQVCLHTYIPVESEFPPCRNSSKSSKALREAIEETALEERWDKGPAGCILMVGHRRGTPLPHPQMKRSRAPLLWWEASAPGF